MEFLKRIGDQMRNWITLIIRSSHEILIFAKEEKRLRYEFLKKRLKEK